MPSKTLHNPKVFVSEDKDGKKVESAGLDVVNYRIEEAELDQYDNPIIDPGTGRPKWTGKTLEWNLKAGETAEFPAYVADYLMGIFDFLEEVKDQPKEEKKIEKAKAEEAGKFICQTCRRTFRSAVNLGMHIGAKHPEKLQK